MAIYAIRFRTEGEFVVLQVGTLRGSDNYSYQNQRETDWRDAKVTDLLEVARYTRAYDALDKKLEKLEEMGREVEEVANMLRARANSLAG